MAIGRLPSLGTFSYQGANATEVWSSRLSGRPVLDGAGRTVKWVEWTLDVSGYFAEEAAGVTTDDNFEEVRQLLTTPGGALAFEDRGFGPLNVNVAGNPVKDLNFGPIPKLITWKPVGQAKACMFTWQCTTCIPECEDARYKGMVTFNYECAFDIDEDGLTTITYSGEAEIAQRGRAAHGRFLLDNADQYIESVLPKVPQGFARVRNSRQVDAAKRVLRWNVVYKQMPYPLPDRLTPKSRVEHVVRSGLHKGFVQWDHSISGNLNFSPRVPKRDMIGIVLLIVFSRLLQAPRRNQHQPGVFVVPTGTGRSMMLTGLEIRDPIWENRIGFSVTAWTVGATIDEILTRSGLFRPVPGSDFKDWAISLEGAGNVWGPRGTADVRLRLDEDVIVDPCYSGELRLPKFEGGPGAKAPLPVGKGKNEEIKKEESWVYYESSAGLRVNQLLAVAKPVVVGAGAGTVALGVAATALNEVAKAVGFNFGGLVGAGGAAAGAAAGAVIQAVGVANCECVVRGRAIRIQHQPTPPKVVQIGDIKVGDKDEDAKLQRYVVSPLKKGSLGGVPIYGISWEIIYKLPRIPGKGNVPVPANPALKLEGDAP